VRALDFLKVQVVRRPLAPQSEDAEYVSLVQYLAYMAIEENVCR
jgi:hypothetical protein